MNTRDSYSGGSLRAGYSRQLAAAAVKHAREGIKGETCEGPAAAAFYKDDLDRRAAIAPAINPEALHAVVRTAGAVPFKASARKRSAPAAQGEGDRDFADHVRGAGQIVSPLPTASLPSSRLEGCLSLDLGKLPDQPTGEAVDQGE